MTPVAHLVFPQVRYQDLGPQKLNMAKQRRTLTTESRAGTRVSTWEISNLIDPVSSPALHCHVGTGTESVSLMLSQLGARNLLRSLRLGSKSLIVDWGMQSILLRRDLSMRAALQHDSLLH